MNFKSTKLKSSTWQFKIDVGGTFTDYISISPNGEVNTGKILSSGCLRSNCNRNSSGEFYDELLAGYPQNFFEGFKVRFLDLQSQPVFEIKKSENGSFLIAGHPAEKENYKYEIFTGEEAPVLVVRLEAKVKIKDDFPGVQINLGTTRGTNALLERKGAKVGLICNKGFKDLWDIGTQARSDLFDLDIKKPDSLIHKVFEVPGRIDTDGNELEPFNRSCLKEAISYFQEHKIESVAICLINSYINPEHENLIYEELKDSFEYLVASHKVSCTIKLLDRGDTTLVDAYLSPIIKKYVNAITEAIPSAGVKLMTSAGGLVSPENFSGKDSLLSGPAGGVNGFSHAAKNAGFDKSIGFDMGGTSTDVKRYGGDFEYHFESVKAGVRVVTPMFAIETVAAGGGSICSYDGQRFLVGPKSAGAFPGPACYGAGGPLTVTDINLFNGKIDPSAFPFKLDLKVVEEKLHKISEKIQASEKKKMTIHEIADGFTRIADFKMAEAIKEISSSKGYDPPDHLLVAFGGAGPQHACSIADLLGMQNILIHPYSGILSAFGIGLTGAQLFEERSILKSYEKRTDFLQEEIRSLKMSLREKFRQEEFEGDISFSVNLDLRYKGESEPIDVPYEDAVKVFEKKHLQFFGYIHSDREIEVVKVRIKAEIPSNSGIAEPLAKESKTSSLTEQQLWIRGKSFCAKLRDRVDLKAGEEFAGPMIIREGLSTIVVEDGWSGKVTEDFDILLSKAHSSRQMIIEGEVTKDPVRLELFNNLFTSIASRMGDTLRRISLSVNIKERLDFSCAVLNSKGDLIVNAPHIPVHLGAVSDSVKALLNEVDDIQEGMVFLTNDPAAGGSHLPDLTVISPVFDGDELIFFTASRAHHAEIGGLKPGSFCPFATNLEEEGVIFRNFLLADKTGFKEAELYEFLTKASYPSRSPKENIADLKAALAAGKYGENELLKVIEDFGKEMVLAYMDFMCESAAEKTAELIEKLDLKESEFTDHFDDGTPVRVKISKSEDRLKIDFTGTGSVNKLTMNANKSIVKSSVLFVLRCLLNEDIPLNEGVLRNVHIELPHCLLNPPEQEPRSAVSAGNVEVSQKICDVLFAAFAVSAASQGTMNNIIFGNENFGFYETLGGGAGAAKQYNGADGVHTNMTNTRLTDVEVIEKTFPVRIESFGYRRGSGGEGSHKGGDGLVRKYLFLEDLELSLVTQRRKYFPFGLTGGGHGLPGKNILHLKEESKSIELDSLSHKSVFKGSLLEILTPGGGGWGENTS